MAVAHYGSTSKVFGRVYSATWSHDSGSAEDRFLLVGLGTHSTWGQTVSSLTYNGIALTKLADLSDSNGTGQSTLEVWYLINPSSGTNTVAAVVTGFYYKAMSITASGVDQSIFKRDEEGVVGGGHDYTISITSAADDYMYSFWQANNSGGWGHGTAGTELMDTGGFSVVRQDTAGTPGTEQGGNNNGQCCHYGISLWGPQALTVDVSGKPAIVAASAAIGAIDDGNITLSNISRAEVAASATIGGVLIKEPIRADMVLYS